VHENRGLNPHIRDIARRVALEGFVAVAPDKEKLDLVLDRARQAYQRMSGIEAIWRQDCHALPNEKEPFGFRDGISHPAIEGSGIPGTNPQEQPLKAGEFVLGYTDEMGGVQKTVPELLGRNGTYIVFRKLHQRVAAFRRYLKENSTSIEEQERVIGRSKLDSARDRLQDANPHVEVITYPERFTSANARRIAASIR